MDADMQEKLTLCHKIDAKIFSKKTKKQFVISYLSKSLQFAKMFPTPTMVSVLYFHFRRILGISGISSFRSFQFLERQ